MHDIPSPAQRLIIIVLDFYHKEIVLHSVEMFCNIILIALPMKQQDTRVVVTKPGTGGPPSQKGQQEAGLDGDGDGLPLGTGRGRRKQLMVTMVGKKVKEKEKI